jgi:hypothetical protein
MAAVHIVAGVAGFAFISSAARAATPSYYVVGQ